MNRQMFSLFDGYQDIVYLIDLEDNTLVYVNKACCKNMGVDSPSQLLGRKCYEALRGFNKVCEDCANPHLCLNRFETRNLSNPITKKFYSMRSTILREGEKLLRLTIAVDLGYELRQVNTIVQMMTISRVISKAQEEALSASDPEESFDALLSFIGNHLECDRVYIFEVAPDGSSSNTYEWCAEGVEPEKDALQNISAEAAKPWYDTFAKRGNVIIRNMEDYKKISPDLYRILKPQNINSLIAGPLYLDNKLIGYYGVDNPPYKDMEFISYTYDMLGNFICSLIQSRNLKREAEAAMKKAGEEKQD